MILGDVLILKRVAEILDEEDFARVALALDLLGGSEEKMVKGASLTEREEAIIKPKKEVARGEKPASCSKCPHYYATEYRCHNERGLESRCRKGYMDNVDTRDWHMSLTKSVYDKCKEWE